MKVAVITPTIGSEHLSKCLESVDRQTYKDLTHYIFIDGEEHKSKIEKQLQGATKVKTITLEENVGKGWYGHRVYAASSFLVNADIVCYLDEDNWYEDNHVERLVSKIQEGYDWAYSLRKIYDKDGNYVCNDNCESLGKWPVFFNEQTFHIDTSSFAVRRDAAVRVGHSWYGQWGADRQFFSTLKHYYPRFACTSEYSMCYRLDGNPNSVTSEFFKEGSKVMDQKYPDATFPWQKEEKLERDIIGPGISIVK